MSNGLPDAEVRIVGNVSALSGVFYTVIGRKTKNAELHAIFRPDLFTQFAADFTYLAPWAGPWAVPRVDGETYRDIAEWFVDDTLSSTWSVRGDAGLPSRWTEQGWASSGRAMSFELKHTLGSTYDGPRLGLNRHPDKRLQMGFYVAVYFPVS